MSLNSLISTSSTQASVSHSLPAVEAILNYLTPMAEKPFNYTYEPPTGTPRDNIKFEPHLTRIQNARSLTSNLSLDREGFALLTHHTTVQDFSDNQIRQIYYREAEALLAEWTGASNVLVFDHNLRSSHWVKQGMSGIREPVKRVHNDFTATSGYARAKAVLTELGDDPDILFNHRFSIVNVWRSIARPVEESPLAVCDAQTIAPTDFVASDLIYRDRVGETYLTTYNPSHRWFYFPQMQPDEVLLIKCFDSVTDGRARFTAHTAFDDPTSPPDAAPRASIELRSLVFY
jgi:hypothetical protein